MASVPLRRCVHGSDQAGNHYGVNARRWCGFCSCMCRKRERAGTAYESVISVGRVWATAILLVNLCIVKWPASREYANEASPHASDCPATQPVRMRAN